MLHQPRPAPSYLRHCGRVLFRLIMIAVVLAVALVAGVLILYGKLAERYDLSKLGEMKQRSVVQDCKGREIGRLHGENRTVVPLSEVSPFFLKALLAREDSRFYEHGGVDYIGVARALMRDFKEKKATQGASTITMQLARNSFDDLSDKSANRKLMEVMLSRRIEHDFSKDRILELYVNRIFFGSGLYGVERASKAYFGHSASELTLGESAMLAGIIRSPNRFSPFRNWNGAKEERDTVLERMIAKESITRSEADAAKREDMAVAAQAAVRSQDSYMMEAARRDLEVILDNEDIEDGGLRIFTTIDQDVQLAADKAVEERLSAVEAMRAFKHPSKAAFDVTWDGFSEVPSTPYLQGATFVINNSTGGIVAIVGGRSFLQSRFDRATMASRTIGSTIKPFVYAAAMMQGMLPGTLINDGPIQPGELHKSAGSNWSPENSDGKFLGIQPAWVGLVKSRNTMTVRVGDRAGMDNVINLLRTAGISEPQIRTPQIYIGNTGTSLRSLTSAMSIFPNQGKRKRPFIIEHIEDGAGRVLYRTPEIDMEVLPSHIARVTSGLLERVVNEGTAAAMRSEYGFKEKAGGKTGTTNNYKDAWFIGYTSELTCGVWVGFDHPQTIMEDAYGGKLALPIWVDVMKAAQLTGYATKAPKAEALVRTVLVCRSSGQLATDNCRAADTAYEETMPLEMVPQQFCTIHGGGEKMRAPRSESGGSFWNNLKRIFR